MNVTRVQKGSTAAPAPSIDQASLPLFSKANQEEIKTLTALAATLTTLRASVAEFKGTRSATSKLNTLSIDFEQRVADLNPKSLFHTHLQTLTAWGESGDVVARGGEEAYRRIPEELGSTAQRAFPGQATSAGAPCGMVKTRAVRDHSSILDAFPALFNQQYAVEASNLGFEI